MADSASPSQINEVLAYQLFVLSLGTVKSLSEVRPAAPAGAPEHPPLDKEALDKLWRDSEVIRTDWRAEAQKLTAQLLEGGVGVAAKNSATVRKYLEELATIPAKKAYSLE